MAGTDAHPKLERQVSATREAREIGNRRIRKLYRALPAMVHSIDGLGRLILVSDVWLSTLGYKRSEVVGRLWPEFLTPASRAYATEVVIPELFRTGQCKDIEYQMVRKDGTLIDILLSSMVGRDANDEPLLSLTVIQDITQRKREQSELAEQHERLRMTSLEMTYRATHDELTGLLNRSEFERRLDPALAAAQQGKEPYVLMYIDLDRFKLVNDAGGHAVGDKLLRQVASLIKGIAQPHAVFARLGGDEFGLLLERCSIEIAQGVAQKICDEIDAFRFQHGDQFLHIGASIGLVQVDERWPTVASLLRAADSACYAAKEAGRNRAYAYFAADEMIESHQKDMQWARRLEHALDNGQLVLHWQEIRALNDNAEGLHGEILVRLVDQNGKLILPGAFLPSAERFHMASRIDRWVVNEAFQWMVRHRDALDHLHTLSINLSGLSIGDRDFHRYVIDLIESMAFDHRKLCFEITETAAISNLSDATLFFESMQAFGVRFALDDFGSGLSCFSYLRNLPADYLKIDGQFIRDLATNQVGQATVRCIQEVARITGKKTVAESVETEAVETLLREIGVDYTQGFLRHHPEPLDTMLTMRPCEERSFRIPG